MAVLEYARVSSSTVHFFCFPSLFSAACAYWSDCHWAVPSDTRSLPWVATINTGSSCQFVDSSNCVFYCMLPSACEQGIDLLLYCGCTPLGRRPWKSRRLLQSKL